MKYKIQGTIHLIIEKEKKALKIIPTKDYSIQVGKTNYGVLVEIQNQSDAKLLKYNDEEIAIDSWNIHKEALINAANQQINVEIEVEEKTLNLTKITFPAEQIK